MNVKIHSSPIGSFSCTVQFLSEVLIQAKNFSHYQPLCFSVTQTLNKMMLQMQLIEGWK